MMPFLLLKKNYFKCNLKKLLSHHLGTSPHVTAVKHFNTKRFNKYCMLPCNTHIVIRLKLYINSLNTCIVLSHEVRAETVFLIDKNISQNIRKKLFASLLKKFNLSAKLFCRSDNEAGTVLYQFVVDCYQLDHHCFTIIVYNATSSCVKRNEILFINLMMEIAILCLNEREFFYVRFFTFVPFLKHIGRIRRRRFKNQSG